MMFSEFLTLEDVRGCGTAAYQKHRFFELRPAIDGIFESYRSYRLAAEGKHVQLLDDKLKLVAEEIIDAARFDADNETIQYVSKKLAETFPG